MTIAAEVGIPDLGTGWWGTASAGLGALGDIYTQYQNAQNQKRSTGIYDILADPDKLAKYIGGLYNPMSTAEAGAVNRGLNANWALQTGGATGGALTQHIADALAKIESERYQNSARNALAALTGTQPFIPGQQPGGQFGNLLKSLSILKMIRGQQGGNGGGLVYGGGPGSFTPDPQADYLMGGTAPFMPDTAAAGPMFDAGVY